MDGAAAKKGGRRVISENQETAIEPNQPLKKFFSLKVLGGFRTKVTKRWFYLWILVME
jgi:hypothetical protein